MNVVTVVMFNGSTFPLPEEVGIDLAMKRHKMDVYTNPLCKGLSITTKDISYTMPYIPDLDRNHKPRKGKE